MGLLCFWLNCGWRCCSNWSRRRNYKPRPDGRKWVWHDCRRRLRNREGHIYCLFLLLFDGFSFLFVFLLFLSLFLPWSIRRWRVWRIWRTWWRASSFFALLFLQLLFILIFSSVFAFFLILFLLLRSFLISMLFFIPH